MTYNGRAGTEDKRSNSYARRARKVWMLTVEKFGGDGTHVNCVHCSRQLDSKTVEADRIIPGGNYRRDNIQPSCRSCNARRGNDPDWVYTSAAA
jgi:hypothetical protein